MPRWTESYVATLQDRLDGIVEDLDDRLEDVASGRVAPALDDITLGSGRKVRAGVLFFDIRGFSSRTQHADVEALKETLYMLDCVIPMMMHVVFDYGGYVEKNTGDGVMAIVGVGEGDENAANTALDIATVCLYVLHEIVNPWLATQGIDRVDARIGLDLGTLLLARVGTPKGTARHDRSHLTAVGPSANLASKIQAMADTNEIWVGDLVRTNAAEYREDWFISTTPANWTWTWTSSGWRDGHTYNIYKYTGRRSDPD